MVLETPLWRLQKQGIPAKVKTPAQVGARTQEEIERDRKLAEDAVANNLFDAVSSPVGDDPSAKPLVRHVLIKDLRKVASSMKASLPGEGLFANRAPIALFAMFEGQSSTDVASGAVAAEWCARQAHAKLLSHLCSLPGAVNEMSITGALSRSLHELTSELHANHHGCVACSAMVALHVSNRIFTAVLGHCGGVLVLPDGANTKPTSLRSKGQKGGISENVEVRCFAMTWDKPPYAILLSSAVTQRLTEPFLVKVAEEFDTKPRAICGEIVAAAVGAVPDVPQDTAQCTAVAVFFRPSKATEDAFKALKVNLPNQPPAKKAKTSASMNSVRLRHILIKHRNCSQSTDAKEVITRSEIEAETMARAALRELMQESRERKLPADAKKAAAAFIQPSPKFLKLCRELSECSTAKNAGGMIGDMGWLGEDSLQSLGPSFRDASKALQVGQWSDVVRTGQGVHILQKIA
mmetsp:Transcript_144520/g.255318  ORF Transcript_144520/g.255318 Transcript_144520/m.255318 type:complete len:464 (-) Transcript_144520:164-1555(-)